jgi:diaminopropionate ammonia-lyase
MNTVDTRNLDSHGCKFSFNPFYKAEPDWKGPEYTFLESSDMLDFHKSIDGYKPTPLVPLPKLALSLGVKEIFVKDESHRYGINAFKGLGASYAIYRFIKQQWEKKYNTEFNKNSFKDPAVLKKLSFTFCAATDGNHGKAVAWTAKKLNQKAIIYMPDDTVQSRIDHITSEGAIVELISGTFDDCVRKCSEDAEKNGWQAISDTAYPGYMDIPKYIMLGYTSIFKELEDSVNLEKMPGVDLVFLPAGVGGVAAAGTGYYVQRYGASRPKLICVEPIDSDCFLESILFGNGHTLPTKGDQRSIMAGLNCGIPSPVAWPIIRDGMDFFMAIPDGYAKDAMREYYKNKVTSGESGSSGLAGLLALMKAPELEKSRNKMGINEKSRILLINTEGDTDPVNYQKIIQG